MKIEYNWHKAYVGPKKSIYNTIFSLYDSFTKTPLCSLFDS